MMPNSGYNANAGTSGVDLWLATPEAADYFDPSAQTPDDHARWLAIKSDARRRDWAVSRALLAHVLSVDGLAHTPARHSAAWLLAHSAQHVSLAAHPQHEHLVQHPSRAATSPHERPAQHASLVTGPQHEHPASRISRPADPQIEHPALRISLPVGPQHENLAQHPSLAAGPQHERSSPDAAPYIRSLSHSHGHAALAIARGARTIGVDLEVARERDYLRLAEFAFHDDEHAEMRALPPDALAERFYLLWTLKEAFAKALGLPLLQSSRECVFTYRSGSWSARIPTAESWIARSVRPRANLFVSIAVLGFSDSEDCVTHHEWPAPRDTKNSWPTSVTLSSKTIASKVRVP